MPYGRDDGSGIKCTNSLPDIKLPGWLADPTTVLLFHSDRPAKESRGRLLTIGDSAALPPFFIYGDFHVQLLGPFTIYIYTLGFFYLLVLRFERYSYSV